MMLKFIPIYILVINFLGILPLLSMQEGNVPAVSAVVLQEFRKRTQEKSAFKIKLRRMMPAQRTNSRLSGMKRRKKRISKKAERAFIYKASLNLAKQSPLELPIEATLTAEQLRILIHDNGLNRALENKESPEEVHVQLERALQEHDFTSTRKGPFRVPHCYNYLSRILMQARRLQLTAEERESLRALLLASQLAQEEIAEISRAFQAIESRALPYINQELWNQKVLDLAVDCDGKSLLEKAYESGIEQIINSVKSIQKIFATPMRFID